jgi:hypothetical protein
MAILSSEKEASFYCNRCDKWVDGIEDKENASESWGIKQVLCDECGGAIRYRPPSFWKTLRRRTSQFLGNAFSSWKKQSMRKRP